MLRLFGHTDFPDIAVGDEPAKCERCHELVYPMLFETSGAEYGPTVLCVDCVSELLEMAKRQVARLVG